jgi:mono/diheme cytochrome c family protein
MIKIAILLSIAGVSTVKAGETNLTYVKDILPIVMTKCITCHNAGSHLPNWMDYNTAVKKKREIKRRIWDSWETDLLRHYYKQPMPAGYGIEALTITSKERETIKDWVLSGCAHGEEARLTTLINTNTGWVAPLEATRVVDPVASNGDILAKGKSIYTVACLPCHGEKGNGDGPAAASLRRDDKPIVPAALVSPNIQQQSDGSMFWKIKEGRSPMPSWKAALTDEQIWMTILYIRNMAAHQ